VITITVSATNNALTIGNFGLPTEHYGFPPECGTAASMIPGTLMLAFWAHTPIVLVQHGIQHIPSPNSLMNVTSVTNPQLLDPPSHAKTIMDDSKIEAYGRDLVSPDDCRALDAQS
jgi:hypothetical protein